MGLRSCTLPSFFFLSTTVLLAILSFIASCYSLCTPVKSVCLSLCFSISVSLFASRNKHFRDRARPALAPPLILATADRVWGLPHALIQALQSFNLRLGLRNGKRVISLHVSGYRSSERHWPKQQWRAPRSFSVISNGVLSTVYVARRTGPFSFPCAFLVERSWLAKVTDRHAQTGL